jgi:S-adenosylmethionine/arginine decarboxylase-like enzyme
MKRHGAPQFWKDYSDLPHLHGISCFQFIETSNIVVHALTLKDAVYINIFSCKLFDPTVAEVFAKEFFKAKTVRALVVDRI